MNKKEIIEMLDERFLENHNEMDEANSQMMKATNQIAFKEAENKAIVYATVSCEIAGILARIKETSFDAEMERLYKKYNLAREN